MAWTACASDGRKQHRYASGVNRVYLLTLSNQFHAVAKGTPHERRDHVVTVGRVLFGCLDNRLLARLDWTTFSASIC